MGRDFCDSMLNNPNLRYWGLKRIKNLLAIRRRCVLKYVKRSLLHTFLKCLHYHIYSNPWAATKNHNWLLQKKPLCNTELHLNKKWGEEIEEESGISFSIHFTSEEQCGTQQGHHKKWWDIVFWRGVALAQVQNLSKQKCLTPIGFSEYDNMP